MRLRTSVRIATLAVAALCAEAVLGEAAAACDRARFVVLLDVGHTPAAPGAISARGVTEHQFNRALTSAIERTLKARGYVRTARLGAAAAALGAARRSGAIGGATVDLVLSIHHDSVQPRYLKPWTFEGRPRLYSDAFRGFSIFVSQAGPQAARSLAFARRLGDALNARGLAFSRHHAEPIPGEGRALIDASRGVYRFDQLAVLRAAPGPAALLEAGVIVNRAEEAELSTPQRRGAIAAAVADAVDRFCASG